MSEDQIGKGAREIERPTRRWMPYLASGLVGVVVGAGAVGLAWGLSGDDDGPSGPQFTATGTVTVFDSWVNAQEDEGCVGTDDFADLRPGSRVRFLDESGHELSQGRLGSGVPGKVVGDSCTWPLKVTAVPSGATQYELRVGDREPLVKTPEELRKGVDLSYGEQQQ